MHLIGNGDRYQLPLIVSLPIFLTGARQLLHNFSHSQCFNQPILPGTESPQSLWPQQESPYMSWATARQPHISHSSAALRCDLLRRSSPQIWRSNPQTWRSSPQTTLAAYSQPALSHLDVVGHSKAALTLATAVQLWDDICCGGAALRYGEATLWYGEAAHRQHWPHTISPHSATCTKTAFVA